MYMEAHNNKISQVLAQYSNAEIAKAYAEIIDWRNTSALPEGDCMLKKVEKAIREEIGWKGAHYHEAEDAVLLEAGKRFCNVNASAQNNAKQEDKKDEINTEKRMWNIPVTWEVCGQVKVPGDTLEEAMEYFNENSDMIPLPKENQYVNGSFAMTNDEYEFVALYNEEQMKGDQPISEVLQETYKAAREHDAELILADNVPIDMKHLNPVWYDGQIASLHYKNYMVSIEVRGEVKLYLIGEDGEPVMNYSNQFTNGAYEDENFKKFIADDVALKQLEDEGVLCWQNNSWVELFLFEVVDDGPWADKYKEYEPANQVLGHDILDALKDVSKYTKLVDEVIAKKSEGMA